MSENISGQGLIVTITASKTFPVPEIMTGFADDADPLDVEVMEIGAAAMGLNGDLVTWSKAAPFKVTINLIPGTIAEVIMETIFRANTVSRGKVTAKDVIDMVVTYPSGRFALYKDGILTKGMPSHSVSQEGRLKTKIYEFMFASREGA